MKTNEELDNLLAISIMDWSCKKMLLIEDDPINVVLIREIFFDTGINILSAMNGQSGLKELRGNPDTDVVLLDIRLPDINGFQVFEKIKEINPNIPVIAITASSFSEIGVKCQMSGFYNLIFKPININNLINSINKVFSVRS